MGERQYHLLSARIGLTHLHPHLLACTGIQDTSQNSPSATEGTAVLGLAPLPALQLPCIIGTYISSRAIPVLSILEWCQTFIGSMLTLSPSNGDERPRISVRT